MADNADLGESYLFQWEATLADSLRGLEPGDAREIRSASHATSAQLLEFLAGLCNGVGSKPVEYAVSFIRPYIQHFETFNRFLADRLSDHKDPWAGLGMLHLTIKLASEWPEALRQIGDMIKQLGLKLELFNEYLGSGGTPRQMMEGALDVHRDLAAFFTSGIRFLRYEPAAPGQLHGLASNKSWTGPAGPVGVHNATMASIEQTFKRMGRLTQLARKSAMAVDLQRQTTFMSSSDGGGGGFQEHAKLPCRAGLPPARNGRFFDRDDIMGRIHSVFHPDPKSPEQPFKSLVLHGLGGVGKTHVALKYVRSQIRGRRVDAVLWLEAETRVSLSKSFTKAARELQLPGSESGMDEENRILLLDWLQQTNRSWLVVFDNAEDAKVLLDYWPPACSRGSILITSRNPNLQFDPADVGIEVPHFDPDTGSKLILHLMQMDIAADISNLEAQSALELSKRLDGHALAISFMAGLMQRRSWSIREFLSIYEQKRSELHGTSCTSPLSAIWRLSFRSLDEPSADILGILAYINPDSIPGKIFTKAGADSLPSSLAGRTGEFEFCEAIEPLLTLALVKRDRETKTFSTHRMVQTQFRYHLGPSRRQKAFDDAVRLLSDAFGGDGGRVHDRQLYDRWGRCERVISQILSLKNNYKQERSEPDHVSPTLQFCVLLRHSARYLLETSNHKEMQDVLSVAAPAFLELPDAERAQGLPVHLKVLSDQALLWAHRGFFSEALPIQRRVHAQTTSDPLTRGDWNSVSWSKVNLGNVLISAGGHDEEALELQLEAEQARMRINPGDAGGGGGGAMGVVHQNIARCHVLLGQLPEARVRLALALAEFEGSKNFAMLAYTLFVQGSLERRDGDLEGAMATYSRAQEVWLTGKQKMHHFNAACMYKLGCVSYDLGNAEQAEKHLREALVVAKLKHDVMPGDYARVLHKLAEVLRGRPGKEVEAAETGADAARVRLGRRLDLGGGAGPESDDDWVIVSSHDAAPEGGDDADAAAPAEGAAGEKEYDDLVYALWR